MPDELLPDHSYEFICIQVDIANHSLIDAPARVLLDVKRRLRSILDATLRVYADAAPYVRMHWNGDSGAFLIQTHDGKPFEKSIWAAFKIRDDMKSLNREFQAVHELTEPIVLRISMDCGNAIYSDDPGTIHSEMLNKLFKYERDIGTPNQVAITDRIYRQIRPSVREMFVERNQSDKLGTKIYISCDDNEAGVVAGPTERTLMTSSSTAATQEPARNESNNRETPVKSKLSNPTIRVDLTDEDWARIAEIVVKINFGAGNSETRITFVQSVVGRNAAEQGQIANLIACQGAYEFRALFIDDIRRIDDSGLSRRLLEAIRERTLNESDKNWLSEKLGGLPAQVKPAFINDPQNAGQFADECRALLRTNEIKECIVSVRTFLKRSRTSRSEKYTDTLDHIESDWNLYQDRLINFADPHAFPNDLTNLRTRLSGLLDLIRTAPP